MNYRAVLSRSAAPLALALLLLGPAAAGAQSVNDLRYRLSTVEAELAKLRQMYAGPGAASGGSGLAATSALDRLDRLEQEIRKLTGRVEEIAHRQQQIANDASRRFDDIEFRLTELEGGDVSALAPSAPLGGGSDASAASDQPAAAVSISERGDLDRAVEDVRQGRYDQAEQRLREFLNSYGESPLRGEALYWLGESQLTRGAYSEAARSFLDGYNSDADGKTAPRTLYRLGVTLGRLGQNRDACLTLEEVQARFPSADSELLDDVVDEANSLGCG